MQVIRQGPEVLAALTLPGQQQDAGRHPVLQAREAAAGLRNREPLLNHAQLVDMRRQQCAPSGVTGSPAPNASFQLPDRVGNLRVVFLLRCAR